MNVFHRSAIGVDWSTDRIRAVRCDVHGGEPRVRGTLSIDRSSSDPGREVERLAGALTRRGFGAPDLWLAVPDEELVSAALELPPRASGAPIEHIAASELGRMFRHDPAGLEVALWELPALGRSASSASQYLAVGCRHASTDPVVTAFNARGMVIRSIEPRMASLARLRRWRAAASDEGPMEAHCILDIGCCRAQLVVLHRGHLIDRRPVCSPCLMQMVEAIAAAVGADQRAARFVLQTLCERAAAGGVAGGGLGAWWMQSTRLQQNIHAHVGRLVEQCGAEVAALLEYVRHRFGGLQCRSVQLSGELSQLPGLAAAIEAHTALTPAVLGIEESHNGLDGALAVACGAALGAMEAAA